MAKHKPVTLTIECPHCGEEFDAVFHPREVSEAERLSKALEDANRKIKALEDAKTPKKDDHDTGADDSPGPDEDDGGAEGSDPW